MSGRSEKQVIPKIVIGSSAVSTRAVSTISPFLASSSRAPSLKVNVVKLDKCEEEFDETPREAKFAFRSTDLGSWDSSSPSSVGECTNRDPTAIQHWAVVVNFPRGQKTYVFEAWKDEKTGLLQPGRAEGVAYQVFEKATYFATMETSPNELLTKAKQVSTGEYSVLKSNTCQTWLEEFLGLISPNLLPALRKKLPRTVF